MGVWSVELWECGVWSVECGVMGRGALCICETVDERG